MTRASLLVFLTLALVATQALGSRELLRKDKIPKEDKKAPPYTGKPIKHEKLSRYQITFELGNAKECPYLGKKVNKKESNSPPLLTVANKVVNNYASSLGKTPSRFGPTCNWTKGGPVVASFIFQFSPSLPQSERDQVLNESETLLAGVIKELNLKNIQIKSLFNLPAKAAV